MANKTAMGELHEKCINAINDNAKYNSQFQKGFRALVYTEKRWHA